MSHDFAVDDANNPITLSYIFRTKCNDKWVLLLKDAIRIESVEKTIEKNIWIN